MINYKIKILHTASFLNLSFQSLFGLYLLSKKQQLELSVIGHLKFQELTQLSVTYVLKNIYPKLTEVTIGNHMSLSAFSSKIAQTHVVTY